MKIKTETVVRTCVLAFALVNQILTVCGKNPLPFSEQKLYEGLSLVATAAASIWAWWKNNSFTRAAREGDKVMEAIKKGEKE